MNYDAYDQVQKTQKQLACQNDLEIEYDITYLLYVKKKFETEKKNNNQSIQKPIFWNCTVLLYTAFIFSC